MRVAVIGGGMFGCMSAIRLAEDGHDVTVFERKQRLLRGASRNNQNRLHLGFHYPRDERTARQCVEGFDRFRAAFPGCVKSDFVNAYFIASEGSLTTPEQYLAFADRVGLRYEMLDLDSFRPEVRGVSMGVSVDEMVYDVASLCRDVTRSLDELGVGVAYDTAVERIQRNRHGFALLGLVYDAVVNCTYADSDRLGEQLGIEPVERQYEYTRVAIVECDHPPVGITIMDGRFMTLLPFGHTGRFLLYHVDHAVIARETAALMPREWLNGWSAPAPDQGWFSRMVDDCVRFVPSLARARLVDCLKGPRVVLARSDATDARPSLLREPLPGYLTVFAGKIDHCMWVADEVAAALPAAD